jgi:RNA polymerase sigma factor (sigma-70 family)
MSTEPLSDEELVSLWITHPNSPQSRQWINELFSRHHRRVALWCLRITGDQEAAADLAQEVFLKAYRNLDSFRGTSSFSTWLFSIARNHSFNYLKSRARRPEEPMEESLEHLVGDIENQWQRIDRERTETLLRQLIEAELDETERRVIVLHYREEVPLASVTRMLGLTNASGAKAFIVSARRKLKRAVKRIKTREAASRSRLQKRVGTTGESS